MRVALACLACVAGCGFQSPAAAIDASSGSDVQDAPADGAPADDAPDTGPASRTRTGLIGLWEFNETAGTTIGETSGATPQVPLTVTPPGIVTFSAGTMTPVGMVVISSGPTPPHLNADVISSHAVTLEAWVTASMANQPKPSSPAVVAGLCSSINTRNISILQAGKRWVARVRTTADVNGGPDLTSSTDITPGAMTHLVVVADATQRILYVNGKADAVDPLPGPPLNWDSSYKMVLGNELSANRQWAGTFALVAMYNQALTSALVTTNYSAGPNAP